MLLKTWDVKHPIIVGLQYGDEGKGKITDFLASKASWVIRYNGGNNAGHTLWLDGKKVVTHSIPSGILYQHSKNFIGSGCVIDPVALEKEMDEIKAAGAQLSSENLLIDHRAHLIFPAHIALDKAKEAGAGKIGTTQRGIGPCYSAKAARSNLRVADLFENEEENLLKLKELCEHFNDRIKKLGQKESPWEENKEVFLKAKKWMKDYISWQKAPFFEDAKAKKCLLEGAQAVMLDIDHGTYPFVTSSNTVGAYAAIGVPFPLRKLGPILGVAKAYLTRVGAGPMPTELNDETGERLREKGAEYGATTGRPRRIGWLDLDELRDALQMTDCDYIALTKSDVLSGEKKVAVFKNGKLEEIPGWADIFAAEEGGEYSPEFKNYLNVIEKHTGAKVAVVGTGTDRKAIQWNIEPDTLWD